MEKIDYYKFVSDCYSMLKDDMQGGRYYHTLTPCDNRPIVVHKQTNQLTTVIKGTGEVVLNGKKKKINCGETIYVKAGTTHQFVALSNELTLFHIHVPDKGRDDDRYIIDGEDYERFEK